MARTRVWIGLDTGADISRLCAIDDQLTTVMEVTVPSETEAIRSALNAIPRRSIELIAVEAGSASTHLTRGLRAAGLPVVIYESRQVSKYLRIRQNKTDNNDARGLAEAAKLLPSISQVHLKSSEVQVLRSQLLFRHKLTVHRVACEAMIRSLFRLHGGRLPASKADATFEANVRAELARLCADGGADLSASVIPLMQLSLSLRQYLKTLEAALVETVTKNPVCASFLAIPGVGPICALSFYTAVENPDRFKRAADVGPYLGLTPLVLQSGASLRHSRTTKRGNRLTRTHLNLAASAALMERAKHHPIKTWGLALAERAGRGKARTAVARRLAITMLAMWKSGRAFDASLAVPRKSSKSRTPSGGLAGSDSETWHEAATSSTVGSMPAGPVRMRVRTS